jgi:septum site-determining protein MinC
VEIKGTRKGLSITLGQGQWEETLQELDERLQEAAAFFQGSQVNLRAGRRDLSPSQLNEIAQLLMRHSIELASLETTSRSTGEAAQEMGIRLSLPEVSYASMERQSLRDACSEGLLLRRTLRSGQSIQHPGHVVIVGDVNPGAEIVAGGDVVVWGRLQGTVQAGALGNDDAIVCALELCPMQLRIGSYIATSPKEQGGGGRHPEVASVIDGQIVARPWRSK